MAKLSITLPNKTLITLEWEETGSVHDVLGPLLRDMQTDQPQGDIPASDHVVEESIGAEKGTGATAPPGVQSTVAAPRRTNGAAPAPGSNGISRPPNGSQTYGEDVAPAIPHAESGDGVFDMGRYSRQAGEDFSAFCQAINPTGDMRRVVVAAEAANRFFGLDGVTADELGELFDLVGWRRANSFTQTIRNAARAKFGWLERIPGRSGRYAATDFGRSTTLSG